MVTFKGSVIDVAKLQSNLDKSEKVRRATDVKFIELQKKFSSTKDSNEKLEKTREKLQIETKDLKKKVRSLEDELKKSQDTSSKHFNILTEFYNKLKPVVAPPEKTEEKSTETAAMVSFCVMYSFDERSGSVLAFLKLNFDIKYLDYTRSEKYFSICLLIFNYLIKLHVYKYKTLLICNLINTCTVQHSGVHSVQSGFE